MLYFLLGKDLHTFENDSFCQMVLDNNALQYASSLNFESVLPFSNYVHENKLCNVFSHKACIQMLLKSFYHYKCSSRKLEKF